MNKKLTFTKPINYITTCLILQALHYSGFRGFRFGSGSCYVAIHTLANPVAQSEVNICVTALSLRKKRSGH